jgi:hypothetical protein
MPRLFQAMGYVSRLKLGAALFLLLSTACGSPRPAATATRGVTSVATPPAPDFENLAWTTVELESIPALVTLPDARGWHARRAGSFLSLEHRASESSLLLRVWKAARLVRPTECEAEARLARPSLPAVEPASRVEERILENPTGFDVRLVVGAQPGPGATVAGTALAVGAGIGRCYLMLYETRAAGPRAAERVADRLGVVVSGVFETIELADAERRVPPPAGVK